jgi:hypothetical protein
VWNWYGVNKKCDRTHYAELVFLQPVGSAGHIVYSCATVPGNIRTQFFMLGWARCGFHKKCVVTHYAELVFLHLVESGGHIMHPDVSGP